MLLRSLFATSRVRHGAAAGVVVLATGGLFLVHAGASPMVRNSDTFLPTTPPSTPDVPASNGATSVSFSGPHVQGTFAVSNSRVLATPDQPFFADITLTADPS